ELATHRAWLQQVLTELLEYPADYLLEGQAIPPGVEAAEPQFGETLRPDWVLKRKDSESRAQLLISLYAPSQKLDGPVAGKVWKAVEILVQALDLIDAESGRQLLAGVSEKDIYDSALTVMMRLVFLFSAEERGLLLLGDALYDQHYAVSTLSALLREIADQHGEE